MKKILTVLLVLTLLCTVAAGAFAEGKTWICPGCGRENSAEANFCGGCRTQKPAEGNPAMTNSAANAWICSACGTICAEEDNWCSACGETHPAGGPAAILRAAPVMDEAAFRPCTIRRIDALFNASNAVNSYTYTAPADGKYHFWLEGNPADMRAKFIVKDRYDNVVEKNDLFGGNPTLTAKLTAGETYTLTVKCESNPANCVVCIGEPRPVQPVGNSRIIRDSTVFTNQVNYYSFVPEVSGIYRITMKELPAGTEVKLGLKDALGNKIDGNDFSGGIGIAVSGKLEAGQEYIFWVRQCEGFSDYTLELGVPNPVLDITGCGAVSDVIYYSGQSNRYDFTPAAGGEYEIRLTGVRNGNWYTVSVLDAFGYKIDAREMNGTYTWSLQLESGKCYCVVVKQKDGSGRYGLIISAP